jgi:hypothetical protein
MDARSNRYFHAAETDGWHAAGIPGDPEEPGVPRRPLRSRFFQLIESKEPAC